MLTISRLVVNFGSVCAVDGVSIDVDSDELVGLIGPNGSGKTTLLNALCGVVPATGRLEIAGEQIPLGNPGASWRAGISRIFQAPQTFVELSVIENILLSSNNHKQRGLIGATIGRIGMWRHERSRWLEAHEILDRVGLGEYVSEPAGNLTYGQRRLLELARAVFSKPKVLLLDEPSAGLNDHETESLGELIAEIHRSGTATVVVDHKVNFLNAICHRLVVLELGRVIAAGAPENVWSDDHVVNAYLGALPDVED